MTQRSFAKNVDPASPLVKPTTITTSHLRILTFVNAAQPWLAIEKAKPLQSKLCYAVTRVMKRVTAIVDAYNESVEDISIAHAAEKDGVIQRDANGSLAFSRDQLQARNVEIRALLRVEVAITPHIVAEVPPDLSLQMVTAFSGFVLPAEAEDDGADEASP